MDRDKNKIREIVERYFKGEYSAAIEQRVKQWLVDGILLKEKDCAMREQWDKLQVKHDRSSVCASYDRVKRTLGF